MDDQATEASTTPSGPSRLSEAIERVNWKVSDECATRDQREREASRRERKAADLQAARRQLWLERGVRYKACSLGNFVEETAQQQGVVRALSKAMDWLHDGQLFGLVLMGPAGTGKDHLMAAMMSHALDCRLIVKWTSGLKLFRRSRDAMDGGPSETDQLREYTKPDILAISDPTWERKPLTDWQQRRLGEIVDERWNNMRPVWATINAEGPADAERMLGAALVDRLRDGALSLACNWSSYRKALMSEPGRLAK